MRIDVGVEAAFRARRAYSAYELFVFEKLKRSVNGGLGKAGQLFGQPAIDRFRSWMSEVFG